MLTKKHSQNLEVLLTKLTLPLTYDLVLELIPESILISPIILISDNKTQKTILTTTSGKIFVSKFLF